MSDCDHFSNFNAGSGPILKGLVSSDLSGTSLSVVINKVESFTSLEEFESFLKQCVQQNEVYSIIRALALYHINRQRLYRYVDCTSIYDFCEKRPIKSPFHLGKDTVNSDLKSAEVLKKLTTRKYEHYDMENYLENHAAETGRGTKDKSDFKIVDFIGHKSKLRELNRLISSNEQMEIDWEAFFDKSTDEYAAYVDSILNKAEDGKKSNASDAAVYDASDVFSIDPYAHLMWDGKTEEHAISFEDQKHEIVVSKLSSGVIRDKEVYKLFSNLDQKRNYRKLIFDFLAKF